MSDLAGLGAKPQAYTPAFTYTKGVYLLGGQRLPYYSVTLPVKEANRFLKLASEVIFDPRRPISLTELFQRELNEDRATKKIVPYLKKPGHIKFFNSLTVALLPVDPDHPTRLADAYPAEAPPEPPAGLAGLSRVSVGPIEVGHLPGDESVGRIAWNTDLVQPVILDGQHRFFSMRTLLNDPNYAGHRELEDSVIPLLLLVFDQRAGFTAGAEASVLHTCRSIFIDLNKHAEQVSRARQYLLDDRDLTAVCMRAVLTEKVGIEEREPAKAAAERVRGSNQLPLSLVDWHSGKAKFDDGIAVTSLFNLYDIVDATLSLPSLKPADRDDYYDSVKKYVERMQGRLDLAEYQLGLSSWLKKCKDDQVPFDLRENDLQVAGAAFAKRWGALVTRPLVELAPYAALVEALQDGGLIGGPLEVWAALDRRGRKAWLEDLAQPDAAEAGQAAAEEVKKQWGDAFQVVFQKGFYQSLIQMADAHEDYLTAWGAVDAHAGVPAFVDAWIARFNRLIAPRLKGDDREFWTAAGRTTYDTIDFTKRGVDAISGLITLALSAPVDAWLANGTDRASIEKSARNYVRDVLEKTNVTGPKPGVLGPLTRQLTLYRNSVDKTLKAIASSSERDLTEDQLTKKRQDWMVTRLADLLA